MQLLFLLPKLLQASTWTNELVKVEAVETCSIKTVRWIVTNTNNVPEMIDVMVTNNGTGKRIVKTVRPGKKIGFTVPTNQYNHVSEVYVQLYIPSIAGDRRIWAGTFNETGGCDPTEHF